MSSTLKHDVQRAAKDFQEFLPKHSGSLIIEHNMHVNFSETTEDYLNLYSNDYDFVDETAKADCIASNEMWELEWCSNKSTDFSKLIAPTLERLMLGAVKRPV